MKTSELAVSVSLANLPELLPEIAALPLTHQCYVFICLIRREPAARDSLLFAKWAKDNESAIIALPKDLDLTQPPDDGDDHDP